MTGWIAGNTWKAGDFTSLVAASYPEALVNAPQHQITVRSRPRSCAMSAVVSQHQVFLLFFGWGSERVFESWRGMFATGPLGFARLSQNAPAVSTLLAHDHSLRDPEVLERKTTVARFAELLAEVVAPPTGPDSEDREDRYHYMRSDLVTDHFLTRIDTGDPFAAIVPHRRAEWDAIQPRIARISGEVGPGAFRVVFGRMDAIGGGRVAFVNYTVDLARATCAITWSQDTVGSLACSTPRHPIVGRPFEVGGQPQRASLVRRDDWCR